MLTGFLGSGKTTLLNELLQDRKASGFSNVAVIVNEFGDVGIDGALIGEAKQVEIPGGCICCLQGQALEDALLEILARRPFVDCIVLETTGIAEPLPIGWSLETKTLEGRVSLRAIVCVVAPALVGTMLTQSPACESQIVHASVLVASHQDSSEGHWLQCQEQVESLNSSALLVMGQNRSKELWALLSGAGPLGALAACDQPVSHKAESVNFEANGNYDMEELSDNLSELPSSIWRVKGVVNGEHYSLGAHHFAIHLVGERASYEVTNAPCTPVVAIGSKVDTLLVKECFERAQLGETP